MCEKQNSVSHISTESEIISLDDGLRLDGLLALELWDLIVSVEKKNMTQTTERPGRPVIIDKNQRSQEKTNALNNIDSVPLNVQSSRHEALYVFEDNEAVIKMIIKGKESYNETRLQNPQSCSWLVVRSN